MALKNYWNTERRWTQSARDESAAVYQEPTAQRSTPRARVQKAETSRSVPAAP